MEKRLRDLSTRGKSSKVKTEMIRDLRQRQKDLKSQITEKNQLIQTLRDRIRDSSKELKSLQKQLDKRDAVIDSVPNLVKEKVDRTKQLKSEQLRRSYQRELNRIARYETQIKRLNINNEKQVAKLKEIILKLRKRHVYKNKRYYEQSKFVKELKQRIKDIKKELTKSKRWEKILRSRIEARDKVIKSLRDKLKYKPKKPKPKLVRFKEELTPFEKELKRIANSGISSRSFSTYELNVRTLKFLEDKELDFTKLSMLLYITTNPTTYRRDLERFNNYTRNLRWAVESGFVNFNALKNNSRYYFISETGKRLIEDYNNLVSYGRSPLEQKD